MRYVAAISDGGTGFERTDNSLQPRDLARTIGTVLEEMANASQEQLISVVRVSLRSAFATANLDIIRGAINTVIPHLNNAETVCAPYGVALEYLQSDRDPAIMERQHPEMRDAVQLLVDAFDEGQAPVYQ